jgi:hypothetical protein
MTAGTPQAGPFDGTWALTPAFTTTCSAGNVAVDVTVGRAFTKQVGADSLEITSDVAVTGQGMTHLDHLRARGPHRSFRGPLLLRRAGEGNRAARGVLGVAGGPAQGTG